MSKEIEAPQAQVSEGLSSSVFEITSPANIPADKSGHKVSRGRGDSISTGHTVIGTNLCL